MNDIKLHYRIPLGGDEGTHDLAHYSVGKTRKVLAVARNLPYTEIIAALKNTEFPPPA